MCEVEAGWSMSRSATIACYRQAARYSKLAIEYCANAEDGWAAGTVDAHDLTLMAVGAAGVSAQGASAAVDAGALPAMARVALRHAGNAVERVRWLLAGQDGNPRLDGIRRRIDGYADLLELSARLLGQRAGDPRRVH